RTTLGGAAGAEGTEITPDLVDILHARTDGVPFFIQEVVRALVERGDITRMDERWTARRLDTLELPASVRAVVGQRLARLSASAREVLYEASVLGQTFRFADLERMGERTPLAWDMALDEAVTTSLLRETGVGLYAFHHALIQQILYTGLPAHR